MLWCAISQNIVVCTLCSAMGGVQQASLCDLKLDMKAVQTRYENAHASASFFNHNLMMTMMVMMMVVMVMMVITMMVVMMMFSVMVMVVIMMA